MYISEGKIFFNQSPIRTIESIPKGNWLVCFNPKSGEYFLKEKSSFELPNKLYGDCEEVSNKFLNTWKHRNKNLGILLAGMKGTGKSLLARLLCIKSELPVLIVTDSFGGTEFIDFLSNIKQEVIIFIDEFEKIYDDTGNSQESLLAILDGGFPSKFLFLLTINEISRINEYLMNRPSRIHYLKTYSGLSEEVIMDIVGDKLNNKEQADGILEVSRFLGEISMDIIISIIEECNLYPDENPKDLLKMMNLKPDSEGYDYSITIGDKIVDKGYTSQSPLTNSQIYMEISMNFDKTIDDIITAFKEKYNGVGPIDVHNQVYSNELMDYEDDDEDYEIKEDTEPNKIYYDFYLPLNCTKISFNNRGFNVDLGGIFVQYSKPNKFTYTL